MNDLMLRFVVAEEYRHACILRNWAKRRGMRVRHVGKDDESPGIAAIRSMYEQMKAEEENI